MSDNDGRPETSEETFTKWLEDMAPFLKLGETLWAAICNSGLENHKTVIYEKVKVNDWFSEKIDLYQSTPGRLANDILTKTLMDVSDKVKQGRAITEDEMKNVRFVAEKHRTAQPYFVTRTESAESKEKDIGKVLDTVEEKNKYERVGQEAGRQMVAPNQPVQDKD